MKIIHTSDWHAGRIWKGLNRLDELDACLQHLATHIESQSTDLVLVTGDLFDSGAPSAAAERLVFQFFKRIGESGAHTVVIAGNHDSADRLEAWSLLTELVNVRAIGRPKSAAQGGVLRIRTRSQQTAIVAAVPFASQRRLVTALELAESEEKAVKTYADKMAQIVTQLSRSFEPGAVNLLCLHTHLEGAVKGASEREVHLGEDWAALPAMIPSNAHYVALGHLHRPQRVNAPSPAYYAGSPLQLDFGEERDLKTFVAIDATPGLPAVITHHPYQGAKALVSFKGSLAELHHQAPALAANKWIRVTVQLPAKDPEINRTVRALLPNCVSVDTEIPHVEAETQPLEILTPSEAFQQYYRQHHGAEPTAELTAAFEQLRQEIDNASFAAGN